MRVRDVLGPPKKGVRYLRRSKLSGRYPVRTQDAAIVTDQHVVEELCPDGRLPFVPPSTWLLATAWKRHGFLDPDHAPGR